jgi:hypothetical protein
VPQTSDGLFTGTLIPNIEGLHKLDVRWAGQPIANSPFQLNVLPKFEPHKVRVDGPGIRHGIAASLPASFIVDTREAGEANLEINIKDPEGNLVHPRIEDNSDGKCCFSFRIYRNMRNQILRHIVLNRSFFVIKLKQTTFRLGFLFKLS